MEIVVVLVLALLVFGPKRLPQAGRSLGRAVREFRKATETARTELGLDEVTAGINDLKSSVGIDDLKSSLNLDLNATTAPPPRQDAAAAAAAAAVAPPADKPVPVAVAGTDTTPAEATASETVDEPVVDEVAGDEPTVGETVAAETAGDGTTATGASGGRDDA
jgi:TatA/E family protein of Tat protein translocase